MQSPLFRSVFQSGAASAVLARLLSVTGIVACLTATPAQANLEIDFYTWPIGQEPVPGNNPPDTLDDVWQQLYNAWGLDPNGDADNDGCSNWFESKAGTNPFTAGDCLRIGNTLITATEVSIFFDAKAGKRYSIVSDNAPNGTFATVETLLSPESGTSYVPTVDVTNKFLKVAKASGSRKFYRLKTEDIDSNGDGVSDWVAGQLGMNPNAPPSGDLDGNGKSDLLDMLEGQLSQPDEISVVASAPFASEDGPTSGTFTISRTRSLFDARVSLSYAGTANSSTDYSRFPSTNLVEFLPGEDSTQIHINPVQDAGLEGGESVTLSLSNPESDNAGTPPVLGTASATVIIGNETAATGTGLLARYYDHASGTSNHAANFGDAAYYVYTRTGSGESATGVAVISPTGMSSTRLTQLLDAITPSSTQVKATFTAGNLNTTTFNHQSYLVTAKTAVNFTIALPPGAALPDTSSGACNISILPLHPALIERVDPVVDNFWLHGTPNAVTIAPRNSPDNYSSVWETYLSPSTATGHRFQLDADDKARLLLDLNRNGVFDLPAEQIVEHGWDTAATLGTFKVSASYNLDVPSTATGPTGRYRMRVEMVETTGEARCRLQWSVNGATFANIPQANQFTHSQTMTYTYTAGNVVVTPAGGHSRSVGENVDLAFGNGPLFVPGFTSTFNGTFPISAVNGTTSFTVQVPQTSVVTDAVTTAGSATVTVPSTAALSIGMAVTGTGIPAGRYIVAIPNATQFTLSSGTSVTAQNPTSLTCTLIGGIQVPIANAVVTQGSRVVLVPSIDGLFPGMLISGAGLANNTSITALGAGMIFLSANASSNQASSNLTAVLHPTAASTSTTTNTGFVLNNPASTTTGVFNFVYPNTTFSGAPGRVGTTNNVSDQNNGIWGTGTPDVALINPETFSVSWTGQIQPQYTEEYTISVFADDGATLRVNGQIQELKLLSASDTDGSTYTYNAADGVTTVTYTNARIKPGSIVAGETLRLNPSSGNLSYSTGATYTYNSTTGDMVVNYSAMSQFVSGGFQVGETVFLDPTSNKLSGLATLPYVITAADASTITVNVGANLFPDNNTPSTGTINFLDTYDLVVQSATTNTFTVVFPPGRHVNSSGNMNIDIVNKPLKDWASWGSSERFFRMPMVAGVRYDIQLDYYENTSSSRCQLYWSSTSQPKQIIPTNRLYPSSSPVAPPAHVSDVNVTALVNGPVSIPVSVTNGASISFSGLPSWLSYLNGELTGTPPAGSAGTYQVLITLTNANGSSQSVVNLKVEQTAGEFTRDLWTGIAGDTMASFPSTTPTSSSVVTSMAAPSNSGDNYATRLRGFVTAPATGNYYFWLAASNAAELWISNDAEPVNTFKRAEVTSGSTTPEDWGNAVRSPWMKLEQGKRYYVEVRHKAGTGAGDNLAVGWSMPGQSVNAPSEVVPGYALSPWVEPPANVEGGTIYACTMRPQAGAVTNASGTSFLRVNEAETEAIISVNYSGLTSAFFGMHVHDDNIPGGGTNNIIADLEEPGDVQLLPDGTYKWVIKPTGGYSVADLIQHIKDGQVYFNVHSVMYPGGEIKGYYSRLNGSQNFVPPPAPPAWSNDNTNNEQAVRFLTQATYGATLEDIAALKAMPSYEAWIDDQFTKGPTYHLPQVIANELSDAGGGGQFDGSLTFNAWWRNSITGPDQLRQRVAFALSQIMVVSEQGPLENRAEALSFFYDTLLEHSFGNFRDLLEAVTLTPAMGRYLDMLRNDKPDLSIGRIPNENYAREIKQLFSIGLFRMWPDGTLMLNSKFEPIDTYTQREIVGLAHVFTGWDYGYTGAYRTALNAPGNWIAFMREVPARHYTGQKRILNNEVLPGLATLGNQPLNPYDTHNSTHFGQAAYQNLPAIELDATHDQLFNHPNTGPFICRQLIQRMVTSHPSRGYVYRVVQKFNDNGSGVRGDMKAVIKAILLDYEARHLDKLTDPTFGKQLEPVLRLSTVARALRPEGGTNGTYVQTGTDANGHVIKITTTDPHKLVGGRTVYLEFPRPTAWVPGDTTPTSARYTVLSTPAPTANEFYVNAKGWLGISTSNGSSNSGIGGTYSIPANSTTMTVSLSGHWLPAGGSAWLDFEQPGTTPPMTDGIYTAATSNSTTGGGSTFTVTVPTNATARSGRVRMTGFRGSFSVANSGILPADTNTAKRITFDTTDWFDSVNIVDHKLVPGDQVYLNFTTGNPMPLDFLGTVESVPDSNTFTVLTSAAIATPNSNTNDSDNGMWMFPLKSMPKTRSGNVSKLSSTFNLGRTDADMDQTPLNAETVFNFFLPDYKFGGALSSAGLTTPEFQLTAETSVIRQANFFYNGLFNPGDTNGISSFRNGSHALVLDLNRWYGNANTAVGSPGAVLGAGPQTGQAWTSNANLPTLINRLNTLLAAGRLSAASRTAINDFLRYERQISGAVPISNPCVINTTTAHGLTTGETVTISGISGGTFSPALNNGTFTVTVVDADTFTVPVNCTGASTSVSTDFVNYIPYSNSSPSDTNKRDRLRAIVHFITSSPDFIIQR